MANGSTCPQTIAHPAPVALSDAREEVQWHQNQVMKMTGVAELSSSQQPKQHGGTIGLVASVAENRDQLRESASSVEPQG